MAKGTSAYVSQLSNHSSVSERRTLRQDQPNPPMFRIDCCEYWESCGKRSNAEFQRFLNIAIGSSNELEYHFLLARDLSYLPEDQCEKLNSGVTEVKKMLAGLTRKIESDWLNAEC